MPFAFRTCNQLRWQIFTCLAIAASWSLGGCTSESNGPSAKKQTAVSAEEDSKREQTTANQPPKGDSANPTSTYDLQAAKKLLADSLRTYRSLERYQDRGQLVIQGSTTLTLPMQVAWERPNRLGLKTASMQGIWSSTTWEAQSLGTVNPFPNQRLVRPLPASIDLAWISDDTMGGLLADPMSKPIQLELLLSNDLSDDLAGSDSKLSVLEPAAMEQVQCQRVVVEKSLATESMRWVLWIDPKSKLLRKVELPSRFYYPTMPIEQLQGVRCSMEFLEATADSPIDWGARGLATPPQEVRVSRWVAPPPIASTPILGQVIQPVDFKDANQAILLDTAAPKKPFNLLVWISDQLETKPLVDDLMNVQRVLLQNELAPACNVLLVCSSQDALGLGDKLKAWNCDLPLAVDQDGKLAKDFQITSVPAMVLLDRSRRVQVAEFVINPQTIASVPELVAKLRGQQDLASRQLQQDLDNQSRFIAALHRVALDKEQAAKLPEITEFPFAMFGMRRDWKVELEAPLVSASGVWYPQAALESGAEIPPANLAMATLDEDGRLQTIGIDGTKKLCAKIEPELADGAKKLTISVDPWTHRWIAVVPDGLPRFWIASTISGSNGPGIATAYNTQPAESPVCHAWIPQESADGSALGSKFGIGTSESRLIMIEPTTEQRLDGTFREPPVAIVPGLSSEGRVLEWDVLYPDGSLHRISNLTRTALGSVPAGALEARLDRLALKSAGGTWFWGKHTQAQVSIAPDRLVEFYLGKLASGETGVAVTSQLHQPLTERALCVRTEQAKLLGTTRLTDGTLMGVATGTNKILHLFSADLRLMDQACFRERIFGASIVASKGDLKLFVALEREVSCWSIDVPDAVAVPLRP